MAEYPPLGKSFVLSYSNNDRDFPIVAIRKDPRVDNYRIPEDLSPHPDSKRWPNHVFTGAQPTNSDERVQWIYEILPSPWVPFTRYDDDLGPVQGRRRSVKNEGQVASLTADKRTTYEAREGSAIVYTELEEAWEIKVDEDGNSLFPIRDRDFYDPSRGPVQERRQLFVPTGEEEGSLENVNGVITQTSYEPYNEFLSVKIVQTYKMDGPQLIGKATDNEGQLVTVTTQRKAADGYVPPNPTATRTVEASREDAESIVERIVDTPQVFGAEVYRKTREDLTPQKFKAAQEDSTVEQNVEGAASSAITLAAGEFAKSEQQISKFVKRVSTTSRSTTVNPDPLIESVLTNEGQLGTRTLTLASGPQTITPSATVVDANVEALGDGRTVKTEITVPIPFDARQESLEKPEVIPPEFRASLQNKTTSEIKAGESVEILSLSQDELSKTIQRITEHKIRETTTTRPTEDYPPLSGELIDSDLIKVNRVRTVAKGKQTIAPSATVSGTVEALGDGYTLKTEDTKFKVFEARTFSAEKADNIPVEFRVEKPATTEEYNVVGNANEVSLSETEIAKSEQQINNFVKRIRKTTRDDEGDVSLSEEQVDADGIKASVTRTLVKGIQNITPSAIVRGQVENLGGGYTVKTEITRSGIFSQRSESELSPIRIPDKFINERKTESFVEENNEETPTPDSVTTNGFGIIESSAEKISKFLARKNKTEIQGTTNLLEKQTNNFKQKITVSSTITSDPDITSGATTEFSRTQSIGGGKFLKEIGTVESVFSQRSFSQERPDPAPEKFRIEIPASTQEITEEAQNVTESDAVLGKDDIAKTVQQIDLFTKRTRTTSREEAPSAILSGEQTGTWGQETVTEEYGEDGSIDSGFRILSSKSTPLGGKKFLKEKTEVSAPQTLQESFTDPETKIILKIEKTLVPSGTSASNAGPNSASEIKAIDAWNSIQIVTSVETLPEQEEFTTTLNYSYPDELQKVGINWENPKDGGLGTVRFPETDYIIENNVSWSAAFSGYTSSNLNASAYVETKRGYSGPVLCNVKRNYFLSPPTSEPNIINWEQVYGTITINGNGVYIKEDKQYSGSGELLIKEENSISSRNNPFSETIIIGPFVHSLSSDSIINPEPTDTIATVGAWGYQLPSGAVSVNFQNFASATGTAKLYLPQSGVPPKTGDKNIILVRTEKWRFGVWIQEIYEATHP